MVGRKKWTKRDEGILKYNLHSSYVNASFMRGGDWIIRDFTGNVLFHAREAFVHAINKTVAELRCVIWTLRRLSKIRIVEMEVWLDDSIAMEPIHNSYKWPRFR